MSEGFAAHFARKRPGAAVRSADVDFQPVRSGKHLVERRKVSCGRFGTNKQTEKELLKKSTKKKNLNKQFIGFTLEISSRSGGQRSTTEPARVLLKDTSAVCVILKSHCRQETFLSFDLNDHLLKFKFCVSRPHLTALDTLVGTVEDEAGAQQVRLALHPVALGVQPPLRKQQRRSVPPVVAVGLLAQSTL